MLSGCFFFRPSLSANSSHSSCTRHGNVLICSGRMPRRDELDDTIDSVIVGNVLQGQWLSFGDAINLDGRIKQIELRKVTIDRIDPGYFSAVSGPNSLRKLTLRSVSGDFSIDQNSLSGLSNSLNQLVVDGAVRINLTDVGKLTGLADLELRNTIASTMPADFLQSLPNLRSVELSNTSLSTLPWKSIVHWIGEDKSRNIKLINFRLLCDCDAFELKQLAIDPLLIAFEKLTCETPLQFQGILLRDVEKEQLCPVKKSSAHFLETTSDPLLVGGKISNAKEAQTEIIVAVSIVSAIVIICLLAIVIYKVRISSEMKSRKKISSNGQTLHQSHKYCAVIEKQLPGDEIGCRSNGVNTVQSINSALLDQNIKYFGQAV